MNIERFKILRDREFQLAAITAPISILLLGGMAWMVIQVVNEEPARLQRIQNNTLAAPLCPSLQGEDWRVISLGKNTMLTQGFVRPLPLGRWNPANATAELKGLAEVLQRFEGKVLSVQEASGEHIVTVADDSCIEK